MAKKSNGRSYDKVPPFLPSASDSFSLAEISVISNEIKLYTQPRKNCHTSITENVKAEVGSRRIVRVCLTILWGLRVKG